MTDLSAFIAFVPEPWRGYALAALYAFLATQLAASGIVAVLPARAFKWRPLRVLSWYAHLAPRDAAGTFKAPFTTPLHPGALEELARLRAQWERLANESRWEHAPRAAGSTVPQEIARETMTPPAPVDHAGERGSAELRGVALILAVSLVLAGLGAVLSGCPSVIREPSLPPPAPGCDAGATLCHEGAPWRCGPEGQWSQADRRCDRLSGADGGTPVVCCVTPSALREGVSIHACVPSVACSPEVSR